MLIHGPCFDAEFVPVFGWLTGEQFALFESRLAAVVPPIRYLKELDKPIHPKIQHFTLKLHRDDRERALSAIHQAVDDNDPPMSRIDMDDCDLATLLRQVIRAWQATDPAAVQLMRGYLCRNLESMVNRLLLRAKIEWAVDMWLDGIRAQEFQFVPPHGLAIRGYLYVGRASDSDGSQWPEPFEAELSCSPTSLALESFRARFGDRARLASKCVTGGDIAEDYPIRDTAYTVRAGGSARRTEDELIDWAFEFTKVKSIP